MYAWILYFFCRAGLRCVSRQVLEQQQVNIDATQAALLLVSAALLLTLAWIGWSRFTTQRAEKRRGEAVIRKQELDNAQAAIDEHNRKIAQILATTERINERQAKLIQDLTDQINRLLGQIDTDTLRHLATEKASTDKNIKLQDEFDKLTDTQH